MPTIEKTFIAHGLECVVARMDPGHLCGYVRIPDGHPWCGVNYGEHHKSGPRPDDRHPTDGLPWREYFDARPEIAWDDTLESRIIVHGGVTYTGPFSEPYQPGWYIGFDTNHLHDEHRGWSVVSVAAETELLAEQIAEVQG